MGHICRQYLQLRIYHYLRVCIVQGGRDAFSSNTNNGDCDGKNKTWLHYIMEFTGPITFIS